MRSNIQWWGMLILGMTPFLGLLLKIYLDQLGGNPIQKVHLYSGDWTLRFLCLSLAISPVVKIADWKWILDYRRMIGLYAFFYATVHVLSYLVLDHALVWRNIGVDIIESPYLMMGLTAYLIMLPMAITSTKLWQKRLKQSWKKLHRLVYFAAIVAVIHYFWQLKGNLAEPLFYAVIVGLLLGFRLVLRWKRVNRELV